MNEVVRREYKIRNRKTGLFSTGGGSPSWTAKGKVWHNHQALGGHFALAVRQGRYGAHWGGGIAMDDLEVVCFETRVTEVERKPLAELIAAFMDRKKKRTTQKAVGSKRSRLKQIEAEAAGLRRDLGITT